MTTDRATNNSDHSRGQRLPRKYYRYLHLTRLCVQLAILIRPECKLLISGSDFPNTVQYIIEDGIMH